MKFLRFQIENEEKIGVFTKDEEGILEISSILGRPINNMIDFISSVSSEEIKSIEEILLKHKELSLYSPDLVKVCSPIKKPIHDIICVGVNYKDHAEETKENLGSSLSTETVYFSKRATEIIGSQDSVKSRLDLDEKLDYESELAVIIGKKGESIREDKAEDYIFGYTIFNDLSSRNLQKDHNQWFRGKSLDTYSSMGPVIVHRSAIPFPLELDITCEVNGEVRQASNTKLLIKNVGKIIAEISQGITLEPGDIIITGTPAGVGMGLKPQRFLKKGDTVICSISQIGSLINVIE